MTSRSTDNPKMTEEEKKELKKRFDREKKDILRKLAKSQHRSEKIVLFILCCFSLPIFISFCATLFFEITLINTIIATTFTIVASLIIALATLNLFTFNVKEFSGVNTVNFFTGKRVTYLQGFHPKWPWEQISEKVTHSLKPEKKGLDLNLIAGDNISVTLAMMFHYRGDPAKLVTFESRENAIIDSALLDEVSKILLEYISAEGKKASALWIKENISQLNSYIMKTLGVEPIPGEIVDQKDGICIQLDTSEIEERYGIILDTASISTIAYSKNYQDAQDAKKIYELVEKTAKKIKSEFPGTEDPLKEAKIIHGISDEQIISSKSGAAKAFVNVQGGKKRRS